jgi:signal peptidase II
MSSESIALEKTSNKSWYLLITALALATDQFTKYWVARTLGVGPDGEIAVIKGFFSLTYTENRGIAFGMLGESDVRWLLVAISTAAIFIVVYYMMRAPASSRLLMWSLALLAAGISGNLVDRIRLGKVIDFLEFYYRDYHFPVFNVADTVISIGAGLMAIELFSAQPPQPESEKPVETLAPKDEAEVANQPEINGL